VELGIQYSKGEYESTLKFYDYISEEDFELIPPKLQAMLKNNRCVVRKCTNCGWITLMARKTWNKYGRPMQAIHGGYWCKPCHTNTERQISDISTERQAIYRRAYDKSVKKIMMGNGLHGPTTIRMMSDEERKFYQINP
jgi:hypothetical protein